MRWGLLLLGMSGCASMHAALDVQAIEAKAALAQRSSSVSARPWPFTTAEQLEVKTRPGVAPIVEVLPIGVRALDRPELIQEQLAFRSRVTLRHSESNHARLYVYRHGRLGDRPVQLCVPGLYVSDLALTLLRPLLLDALAQGADVAFFVPPYHLERTPQGLGSGDAVLATELADHLGVIEQGVADLRDAVAILRRAGVTRLGVFAGSMGANFALQVARFDGSRERPAFEFMTVMIPLIDWGALLLERPEFAQVRAQLVSKGVSLEALAALYETLDPSRVGASMDPKTISVLAARFDQVTPAAPRERWQRAWGLSRVQLVDRGHATMLLSDELVTAAHAFLVEDLARR